MITKEEIISELEQYLADTQQKYNEKDGQVLAERITRLNRLLARSAELMADAQFHYDCALGVQSELLDEKLAPSKFTQILKSKVAVENRLLKLTERLNRTITHQLDSIRSQLSFLKSFNE